jgi:tetrahydromethanopterin S-methyltransferase subunit G
MTVAAPKKVWTGDRLDGLEKKVDDGFAQVDERFEKVDKRFDKVEGKIESLDSKFDTKFDGLNKTLLGAAVSIVVTLIACCAALVGAGPF